MTPPSGNVVSITFFHGIVVATTKIVNSKSLRKICLQLLSTMNVLNLMSYFFSNNVIISGTNGGGGEGGRGVVVLV